MKQAIFEIRSNRPLAPGVFELVLAGDTTNFRAPGQFAALALEGFYLRRPLSVCDWDADTLTLVYRTVGQGTAALSAYPPGRKLDLLTGLGNGYALAKSGDRPLLVGGGLGAPPLYALARRLLETGCHPAVVLGFNRAEEVILRPRFEALGLPVTVCTADGSLGVPGFVTAGMARAGAYSHVYACGPEPMLRAVWEASPVPGQYSFEARMGCGFGACMGCSRPTRSGSKRICREGPVLESEEILW